MNNRKAPPFLTYVATIVGAIIALAVVGTFLYLVIVGRTAVPGEITAAITAAIVTIIPVAAIAVSGMLTRKRIADAATLTTMHSDINAAQTQAHVERVVSDATATVATTLATANPAAAAVRDNTAATEANTDALTAVISGTTTVPQDPDLAGGT